MELFFILMIMSTVAIIGIMAAEKFKESSEENYKEDDFEDDFVEEGF